MIYQIAVPTSATLARSIVEHEFTALFGGWTQYDVHGGWVNSNGNVERECMTVYTGAIINDGRSRPNGFNVLSDLRAIADRVRLIAAQEAVFYGATPGAFYLATAPEQEKTA